MRKNDFVVKVPTGIKQKILSDIFVHKGLKMMFLLLKLNIMPFHNPQKLSQTQ